MESLDHKQLVTDIANAIGADFTLSAAPKDARAALNYVEKIGGLDGEDKQQLLIDVLIHLATEAAQKTEATWDDIVVETVGKPLIKSIVLELVEPDGDYLRWEPTQCSWGCMSASCGRMIKFHS